MPTIKNNNTQKILITLGVILLLTFVYILFQISNKRGQNKNLPANNGIEQKQIAAASIPSGIPQDAPFLQSGTVLQNTTTESATTKQGVRVWVTASTVDTALQTYKTYFEKNGWTIISTYSQNGTSLIGASKAGATLSVSVKTATQPNQVTIELTAISNL